jgi:hypothetical protein
MCFFNQTPIAAQKHIEGIFKYFRRQFATNLLSGVAPVVA